MEPIVIPDVKKEEVEKVCSPDSSHSSGYATEKSTFAEKSNEELIEEAVGSPKNNSIGPVITTKADSIHQLSATEPSAAPVVSYGNDVVTSPVAATAGQPIYASAQPLASFESLGQQHEASPPSISKLSDASEDQMGSPLGQSSPAKQLPVPVNPETSETYKNDADELNSAYSVSTLAFVVNL